MQPPDFVLFLDENHCNNRHLLQVLKESGIMHERYSLHFAPGKPDVDWLPFVGKNNWCLLTTDKRIRHRALEKEAVRRNNIRMYCFSTNTRNGREIAATLVAALPAMVRLFARQQPPFIAMIAKSGSVHLREEFDMSNKD